MTKFARWSAAVLLPAFLSTAAAAPKKNYQYFRVGSTRDVSPATTAGTVLMGGGTDVDAAFAWMCNRSGNGDFLVIRATGTDAYNPYIQQICPASNSVATLIAATRSAANDAGIANIVRQAEAIFIAGGDQSDYIEQWTGTLLQSEVANAALRGVPIGGTSAGMNVLTQFVYSAEAPQGVTSSQALADPYNRYITLARDFIDLANLGGTIGDPHFVTRDRMGRDLAFLCRIYNDGWSPTPRGISVDTQTALEIDASGNVAVVGVGTAYFLKAPGAPEVCANNVPLTYRNVAVYRIRAGGSFNLGKWTGGGGTAYAVSANDGVLSSTQSGGAIY